MRASRNFWVWTALVICAVTLLSAMSWQTRSALAAERERSGAQARADLQEKMRLALWRMDTLGAALIVEEAKTRSLAEIRDRFNWQEGTPNDQIPTDEFRQTYSLLNQGTDTWRSATPQEDVGQQTRNSAIAQKSANTVELQKRSQAVDNTFSQNITSVKNIKDLTLLSGTIDFSPRPLWLHGALFLLKPIPGPPRIISGGKVNLEALCSRLLAESQDLLPNARLLPAEAPTDDGLVLASFPLRLEPGSLPLSQAGFSAPIVLSLVAGWVAAVIAIAAAWTLVFSVMRLSERRASFVSAVTHELRTPLTTFRLYSDMLQSGVVKEEKRGEYLRVLSREADRLSHLVENVLAFSQIERGSARASVAESTLAELLEPMRERLEARLAASGQTLEMDLAVSNIPSSKVKVNCAAVEHILFNLIDNAAKHAAGGEPPLVKLSFEKIPGFIRILVADHGPGIPSGERRRIFRAFHKSAREAAESRPGVGLGLALSLRLAKDLGGNLECAQPETGACFILKLPA